MRIEFRDRSREACDALAHRFAGVPGVSVVHGDIFDGPVTEAIFSPANSHVFFDGGIDAVYAKEWPAISGMRDSPDFFIPIGAADAFHLVGYRERPYELLIVAPTMVIPESIKGTTNVYWAFRAALKLCQQGPWIRPPVESATSPCFGTGVGEMDTRVAAYQMRMAYRHVFEEPFDAGKDTLRAIALEVALRTGGEIEAFEP